MLLPRSFRRIIELLDSLISSPADGDVLTYRSSSGKWQNQQPAISTTAPGGQIGAIQYGSGNTFAGSTGLTVSTATGILTLAGALNVSGGGSIRGIGLDQNIVFNDNGVLSVDANDYFCFDKTSGTLVVQNLDVSIGRSDLGFLTVSNGATVTGAVTASGVVIVSNTASTWGGHDVLKVANNLSDVANAGTARANLGLGPLATANYPTLLTISATSSGTVYTLTGTSTAATFGTTSPRITLTTIGTWLILAGARATLGGGVDAAPSALINVKSQVHGTGTATTQGTTASVTASLGGFAYAMQQDGVTIETPANETRNMNIPPFVFTNANTDDTLTLFANSAGWDGVGTMQLAAGWIMAIRIG